MFILERLILRRYINSWKNKRMGVYKKSLENIYKIVLALTKYKTLGVEIQEGSWKAKYKESYVC